MKLILEWRSAWKFASIQWSALGVLLMSLVELANYSFISLPPSLQAQIPHSSQLALGLFALTMVGRLLKLSEPKDEANQ